MRDVASRHRERRGREVGGIDARARKGERGEDREAARAGAEVEDPRAAAAATPRLRPAAARRCASAGRSRAGRRRSAGRRARPRSAGRRPGCARGSAAGQALDAVAGSALGCVADRRRTAGRGRAARASGLVARVVGAVAVVQPRRAQALLAFDAISSPQRSRQQRAQRIQVDARQLLERGELDVLVQLVDGGVDRAELDDLGADVGDEARRRRCRRWWRARRARRCAS